MSANPAMAHGLTPPTKPRQSPDAGSSSGPTATRRQFLRSTTASVIGTAACLPGIHAADPPSRRPRVAAIFTVLRFRSHAYNILENFLGPYYFRGHLTDPGVDVVAMYADQFPSDDMAREAAARFGIPLYPSIADAMCEGGTELAVDAVLSIGEHGDYPWNDRGQQMYPRKEFFDAALGVMHKAVRYVPFFNDKHLSYRWDWAREMFDASRRHGFPLLAGSSVPLAQRLPAFELPRDAHIEEAVSIHGGSLESYDFHALEVLESIVENRSGGETGIKTIQLLTGDAYQAALRSGRWSTALVQAAIEAEEAMAVTRQARPTAGVFRPESVSLHKDAARPPHPTGPHAITLTYRDGLRATVLRTGSSADLWAFACRLRGESAPRAFAYFNSPWGNRGLFKALSHAIQRTFIERREPWPAERTLLTTGAVEAVMQSYEQGGAVIETPQLNFAWKATDWQHLRENGDTWKIITADTPQPATFAPRSLDELRSERGGRE